MLLGSSSKQARKRQNEKYDSFSSRKKERKSNRKKVSRVVVEDAVPRCVRVRSHECSHMTQNAEKSCHDAHTAYVISRSYRWKRPNVVPPRGVVSRQTTKGWGHWKPEPIITHHPQTRSPLEKEFSSSKWHNNGQKLCPDHCKNHSFKKNLVIQLTTLNLLEMSSKKAMKQFWSGPFVKFQ